MGRLALLAGLMVVAGAAAAAATTYRWVDAEGVTHYSDQPHPGADKIQLVQPQTYTSQAPPATAAAVPLATQGNARTAGGGFRYDTCSISQPAADEVLFDPAVTVHGQLAPSLRPGDKVVLVFDGASMEAPTPGQLEFHIEPVERGTHTVSLQVRDATGKSACQGTPVSFHVRQSSELSPQNPNNPARKR